MSIPTLDGPITGYLATPRQDGPRPGVVVMHEAFGLNDDIRRWADRFADAGYLALAPDLYSRGPTPLCLLATFRTLIRGHGRAVGDIEAARAHLAGQEGCTGRVGIAGFCQGGGFALLMAARGGFDAAAPNYGHLPSDAEEVLRGACPIVASYGKDDLSLRGAADRLRGILERAGVPHDVKEYPGARHSFLNDHEGVWKVADKVLGIGRRDAAADDAWRRIQAFFAEHLGG